MKEQQRFPVCDMARMYFDFVVRVSIGNEQVSVAVVVVVEEFHAPAAHQSRQAPKAHGSGHVLEAEVVSVAIDRIHFLIHIGYEKILPAILIEIRRIDPHAGSFAALLAVGHAGFEPNVLEFCIALV